MNYFGVNTKIHFPVFYPVHLLGHGNQEGIIRRRKRGNITEVDTSIRLYKENSIWNIINCKTEQGKTERTLVIFKRKSKTRIVVFAYAREIFRVHEIELRAGPNISKGCRIPITTRSVGY